jgi:hypothetical protein
MRAKWNTEKESWEEYLENNYQDLDTFFKEGGTKRQATRLADSRKQDWSDGAILYFAKKAKIERQANTVRMASSKDARVQRILTTCDSTGKKRARRFS